MGNREYFEILLEGRDAWNAWRRNNSKIIPDISGFGITTEGIFDMSRIDFRSVNLTNTILAGADLSGALLSAANFENVDLSDSNLSNADLRLATLIHVSLCRADLTNAKIPHTNFYGADLRDANFSEAIAVHTSFDNIDLSVARGLEFVEHRGPSTIGIDTVYLSKGRIPEVFLRGCGVPDTLIAFASYLVEQAIDLYSCFISFSSHDHAFAERLYSDLQNQGVRCWFAPEDMKIGDRLRKGIDESIRAYDKLLLVLSRESIRSEWVEAEVEAALDKEKEQGRTVLFPIRLDDTVMSISTGWPALVKRTRHIGDFTQWKQCDSYQAAFERLRRDLRITG